MEQLEQARRNQRMLELDVTAEDAARDGRWEEAVDALEAIVALQPSEEVTDRLAQAQRELRITELQNDIRALAATGDWPAVLAADAELAGLGPEAANPDGPAIDANVLEADIAAGPATDAKVPEAEIAAGPATNAKELNDHDWTGARPTSGVSPELFTTGWPPPGGQRNVNSEEVVPARKRRFHRLVLLFLTGLGLALVPMLVFGIPGFEVPRLPTPSPRAPAETVEVPNVTPRAPVETVKVPNVTTRTEQQARDQLSARHLQVEVRKINGNEETTGTITAQHPVGGTQVEVNSIVTITFNEGPKTGTIPDRLVGRDVKDVESALDDLHFTNVKRVAAKSENPDSQPGEVVSISPKVGSTVPLDSEIVVTYATGKSEVPNFESLTQTRAIQEAKDAGFGAPRFVTEESSRPAGSVIAQNPRPGAMVERDTIITLTLATAPQESPPPTTKSPTQPPTTKPPTTEPPTTEPPTTQPPTTEPPTTQPPNNQTSNN